MVGDFNLNTINLWNWHTFVERQGADASVAQHILSVAREAKTSLQCPPICEESILVASCKAGFRESGISKTLKPLWSVSPASGINYTNWSEFINIDGKVLGANECWCRFARWPWAYRQCQTGEALAGLPGHEARGATGHQRPTLGGWKLFSRDALNSVSLWFQFK